MISLQDDHLESVFCLLSLIWLPGFYLEQEKIRQPGITSWHGAHWHLFSASGWTFLPTKPNWSLSYCGFTARVGDQRLPKEESENREGKSGARDGEMNLEAFRSTTRYQMIAEWAKIFCVLHEYLPLLQEWELEFCLAKHWKLSYLWWIP